MMPGADHAGSPAHPKRPESLGSSGPTALIRNDPRCDGAAPGIQPRLVVDTGGCAGLEYLLCDHRVAHRSTLLWMVAMKRLTVLLSVAVLILGFAVAPPAAAAVVTGSPDSSKAGPSVFVGEVTAEQLGKVLAFGIDRSEVVTSPGAAAGTVRVEV